MSAIIGIKINNKIENSIELQKILTKYNCHIKIRLGINNSGFLCSDNGIIILILDNHEIETDLEKELFNISEIEIQRMIF